MEKVSLLILKFWVNILTEKDIQNSFSINAQDLEKFIGVCILTSVHQVTSLRRYWSYEVGNNIIRETISINKFEKIVIVEENMGQLYFLFKSTYSLNILSINQVTGKPFDYLFLKNKILDII